jgi:hypothetical protein
MLLDRRLREIMHRGDMTDKIVLARKSGCEDPGLDMFKFTLLAIPKPYLSPYHRFPNPVL